ncbi:hypothetical protein ABT352_33850 [Streptosporangium sp. NPDC000563]|uniref:hypothetical protein n=1 Tax=unclassified Streptosporangium TaxID=2632669 RepID=UPI00331F7AB4
MAKSLKEAAMGIRNSTSFTTATLTGFRLIGLTTVTALLLSACGTPRDEEQFIIINATQETVTVKGKLNKGSFAVLAPGEDVGISLPDSMCHQPEATDVLVATSTKTGKSYTYGPPICYGTRWKIGG